MEERRVRQIQFKSAKVYWDGTGLPFIVFNDGKSTYALPRQPIETESLGYDDVALGNFEHECLHVFLAERRDAERAKYYLKGNPPAPRYVPTSVLYRAAHGEEFVGQNLQDAIYEESLVLGL